MSDPACDSQHRATAPKIRWYRTSIERQAMAEVLARSNWLAAFQTIGYLAIISLSGAAAMWAWQLHRWWALPPLLFAHGMVTSFLINAVHELGHETVFANRRLNRFFAAFFAFFGWINHRHFAASHSRHHRFTLHPPADLEVTLPITLRWRDFWRSGFFRPLAVWSTIKGTWATARGRLDGEWDRIIFDDDEAERRAVIRWARWLLIGHGLILIASLAARCWIAPLVISFPWVFGGWLFWLVNNTQHVGLEDEVADARRCCRTILINPLVRFLYWQMNFHTEHHMFAAVPCYRLGRLHRLIRHDLPPCPSGLIATWRHIMEIMRRQAADPSYRYRAPMPDAPATVSSYANA